MMQFEMRQVCGNCPPSDPPAPAARSSATLVHPSGVAWDVGPTWNDMRVAGSERLAVHLTAGETTKELLLVR
jgi:hypothetical protein